MYLKHDDLSKYFTIDIEANGLDDATRVWCLVQQNVATGAIHKFVGHDEIRRWASELPSDYVLIGHNILSYDVPTLNRLIGLELILARCIDTLVLSYLFNPQLPRPAGLSGKKGPHSLEAWGLRLNDHKGDYDDWSKFTPEMLEYCVQDVKLCTRVFTALTGRLRNRGFSEQSVWIEHRIRVVVDKQERTGFCFDVPAAQSLYDKLRGIEADLSGPIKELFPAELVPQKTYKYTLKKDGEPTSHYLRHLEEYDDLRHNLDGTYTVYSLQDFNIGSPAQRVKRLLSLGWEPTTFTPTGNPKVDEDALVKFADSCGRPQVQAIADWLVANGRANMVNTWLSACSSDGRIHGRVFTCGAITRRMRHNSPNTANIPGNEAKFGHECRSLWRASPGRVLVGYDAAALEMRMFGHYLNNKEASDLYIYGDPHTFNAEALTSSLGVPFERKPVKTDFYAFLYGASNGKLGSHYGKGAKFGKQIRETLLTNTPGLLKLAKQIEEEAESGWIRTIDGGFVRSLSPHAALNSKLQSAGGIAMKVTSIFLDERLTEKGLDSWKVGDIHDEGQQDTDPKDAEEVGKLAVQCLKDAGEFLNMRVPLDGEYKIGETWAQTH